MRRFEWALVASFVALAGTGCKTPPPGAITSIASVTLSGPTSLPNDGPNSTYTAVVTVVRAANAGTGPVTLNSPWWLVDQDSSLTGGGHDLLSFVSGITIPANSNTATINWDLGCRGRTVQGTALTGPGGSANSPDSGEGNGYMFGDDSGPADLMVQYENNLYSNGLFVSCICNGSVCP